MSVKLTLASKLALTCSKTDPAIVERMAIRSKMLNVESLKREGILPADAADAALTKLQKEYDSHVPSFDRDAEILNTVNAWWVSLPEARRKAMLEGKDA